MDGFAALEAFAFIFAGAFKPRDVINFVEKLGKDVGWVFLKYIDFIFGSRDEGDEVLDGEAGFFADGGGEKGI